MTTRAGGVPESVVVVGGGAAAVFVTVALRERADALGLAAPLVTVVGREPVVGRGLAYGHAEPHHRLNSPARTMSVSPADDQGFVRWLDDQGWRDTGGSAAGPGTYVPRMVYGDYLEAAFAALLRDAPDEVTFVHGEATSIRSEYGGVAASTVELADGRALSADRVVLALGNLAPPPIRSTATRSIDDPWAAGAFDGITADDRVLLIGTGLTTVDVATSLARRVPGLHMTATSRRLLLPAVHLASPAAPGPGLGDDLTTLGAMISAFGRQIREAKAAGSPWQPILDGIRPQVGELWQRLSIADRRRFLEHAARRWDVHRHRMARSVWRELSELLDSKTLTLEADTGEAAFDVAVNCTGPASLASGGWSALVDGLLDAGLVRADPTGIGFEADASGALVTAAGEPSEHLFTIGSALKGALWESVAVPEVRQVAGRIAERVLRPALTARVATEAGSR